MNPYVILAVLVMALGSGGAGYFKGRADNEAKHVSLALMNAQADAIIARQLAIAEQKARLLALELEDQANADPVVVPDCLSVDRVRRLNIR